MPLPFALPIEVSDMQRTELKKITCRRKSFQGLVWRAQIVLYAAEGLTNDEIANRIGKSTNTVREWRARWAEAYGVILSAEQNGNLSDFENLILTALSDKPRSGAPCEFSPEQICQIIAISREDVMACGYPVSHWAPDILRLEAIKRGIVDNISERTIGRFLEEAALKPSQLRYWEYPNTTDNPQFKEETKNVCQTYEQAPELAKQGIHTVSADEKTAIQAKGAPYPTLPMTENKPERQEFTYTRNGTLALIGSFDVVTGQITPSIGPTRNEADFLEHIKKLSIKTLKQDGYL